MSCKSNTKFPFKAVYFLGISGLTTCSYILCNYTTSGHIDLQSICLLCIQYIYISIQYIFYFSCNVNVRDAFLVFGMVNSDRTVVVLLHKYFRSRLSSFCNAISIISNQTYANMSESYIMVYVNNLFMFFKLAYDI